MPDTSQRPRVVIVGGGFGGLEASKVLANAEVDVTLVDAQNHHCFQPLLYQVATASLSPADVAWPIRAILRQQKNVRVIMARVTGIDTQARCVKTSEIDLPYDYLVLATGATHSYFGHDDWAPFAPGLKHIGDATEIRRRFLIAFERAEVAEDEAARRRLLTFVIVGGGATGVEMAGAVNLFGQAGAHSPWMTWQQLVEADPDVIVSMPCGFDLARTCAEMYWLDRRPEWPKLRAVQTGQVYLADGNQYFNRPGPRIVESLRILAEILHPEVFEPAMPVHKSLGPGQRQAELANLPLQIE